MFPWPSPGNIFESFSLILHPYLVCCMKIIWKFVILVSLYVFIGWYLGFIIVLTLFRKMKVDNTRSKKRIKLGTRAFFNFFAGVPKYLWALVNIFFHNLHKIWEYLTVVWAQRSLSILSLSLTFSLFALRLGCPGHCWAAAGELMPRTLSLSETLTRPVSRESSWAARQGASFQCTTHNSLSIFSSAHS